MTSTSPRGVRRAYASQARAQLSTGSEGVEVTCDESGPPATWQIWGCGRLAVMGNAVGADDVRRRAGWFPDSQQDLEAWLKGHRERAEARGEDVVLHPVIIEFQELIDSDPVVRMYLERMIEQVPRNRN